jgi:hypothetical protein
VVSITPWPSFRAGKKTPGTRWTGGWVGPRAGLDTEARGKILLRLPGIEPRLPDRPACSQTLTDWATWVTIERFSNMILQKELHGMSDSRLCLVNNFTPMPMPYWHLQAYSRPPHVRAAMVSEIHKAYTTGPYIQAGRRHTEMTILCFFFLFVLENKINQIQLPNMFIPTWHRFQGPK